MHQQVQETGMSARPTGEEVMSVLRDQGGSMNALTLTKLVQSRSSSYTVYDVQRTIQSLLDTGSLLLGPKLELYLGESEDAELEAAA